MAARSSSTERTGAEGPIPHAGSSPALRGARSASFAREVRRAQRDLAAGESTRRSAESSSPRGGIDGELVRIRKMLTDDWVAWKCAVEDRADDCLGGEVCDCSNTGQRESGER
jgi:hypothetical protein